MKRLAAALLCAALFAAFSATAQEPPAETAKIPPVQIHLTVGQKSREAQVLHGQDRRAILFYGQNSYQCLWFDARTLDDLREAAKKYESQFQSRSLKRSRDGSSAYASAAAFLEWGSKKELLNRSAPAKIRLGYVFMSGSPYFCVTVPSVQSQADGLSPALSQSEESALLFTRAQLQAAINALCASN